MIEFLKGWILNIVILVLFIVLIEILTPSGKLKKHINLVSGFILMIAVLNPLINFIKGDIELKEFEISSSNFIDRREIEKNSKTLKEQQVKQIIEVYRNKVINQIENSVKEVKGVYNARADIIINEDYSKESFGEVKRVYLYIRAIEDGLEITPIKEIEKIKINDFSDLLKNDSPKKGEIDEKTRSLIEEKVRRIIDIQENDIVISIDKD